MKQIVLDDTRQAQLYERSAARMAQLVPGWSDAIASDPAVAVLELATYLSDIQNHALDQVQDAHYESYLRLLGATPYRLQPARMLARRVAGDGIYEGQRFSIDGLPFEVVGEQHMEVPEIACVSLRQGAERSKLGDDRPLILHPTDDKTESVIKIKLCGAITGRCTVRVWVALAPEPGRNRPEQTTRPPIQFQLHSRLDGGVWHRAYCEDGTCGLLQSGWLQITLRQDTDEIRLRITGTIEGTPQITALVLEPVQLVQQQTRSKYLDLAPPFLVPPHWAEGYTLRFFCPAGSGWREMPQLYRKDDRLSGSFDHAVQQVRIVAMEPDFAAEHTIRPLAMEELPIEEEGILPEQLSVMVEENDGIWYEYPVCAPLPDITLPRGCRWDSDRKLLRFGDGRDFAVPHAGSVLLTRCVVTMGAAGNGAGGELEQGMVRLQPLSSAAHGRNKERAEAAFHRTVEEQVQPLRAVTPADYEVLARCTPGLHLTRVRAIPNCAMGMEGAGITLLAKPQEEGATPMLTPWQRETLERWIQQYRMLGVPVRIQGPRYCPIHVSITLRTHEPIDHALVRSVVVRQTDGVTGPLDFGAELSYTALFTALGAVAGVRQVLKLELTAHSGGGRRQRGGGIQLAADVLPYLGQLDIVTE